MKLSLEKVGKTFGSRTILEGVTKELESGKTYCLMGTSGVGKTTLLRILLGLERADAGSIEGTDNVRMAAVFQEDRLCEHLSAVQNVMLVLERGWTREKVRDELEQILPAESLDQPVKELSGGMRRRVAICRALLASSEVLVMDEPFSGLDEETRKKVIAYIRRKKADRLLIVATHQMEDAALLEAELWKIKRRKSQ